MKIHLIIHLVITLLAALAAPAIAQPSAAVDYARMVRQIDADYAATAIRLRRELAALGEQFKHAEQHLSQIREQVDAVRARHAKASQPIFDPQQVKQQIAAQLAQRNMIQQRILIAEKELSAAEQRKQAAIATLRRQQVRTPAAAEPSRE